MLIYKTVNLFDPQTGEKLSEPTKVDWKYICDFSGEEIESWESPGEYSIDYGDKDPCFGSGEGERWYDGDWYWEIFGQTHYQFKTNEAGYEGFAELIKKAQEEMDEGIIALDHLLRWSRGKMIEKLIKESTYTEENFYKEY